MLMVEVAGFVESGSLDGGAEGKLVTQQLPSSGQLASESMSSQNNANKPPTHSPLHGCSGRGDVGAGLSVVEYGRGVTVVNTGFVEPLSAPEQCNHIISFSSDINVFIGTCIRTFQQLRWLSSGL